METISKRFFDALRNLLGFYLFRVSDDLFVYLEMSLFPSIYCLQASLGFRS